MKKARIVLFSVFVLVLAGIFAAFKVNHYNATPAYVVISTGTTYTTINGKTYSATTKICRVADGVFFTLIGVNPTNAYVVDLSAAIVGRATDGDTTTWQEILCETTFAFTTSQM